MAFYDGNENANEISYKNYDLTPISIGSGLLSTAYNIYTNWRDFDYQKSLQKQIFERDDNAIQRRVADLKAAGINPNLAAGQGADAGTVVSRSNTNDVNFGAYLDHAAAINNLRQQRYQTQVSQNQAKLSGVESMYRIHELLSNMGITTMPYYEDGKLKLLEPDNAYPSGNTIPQENYYAQVWKARSIFERLFNEKIELRNKLNQTTKDMIMGNTQISNWSFENTLNLFQALTGKDLKEQDLELQAQKLGVDIKKMNFQQMIQTIPLLLMIMSY